MYNAWGGSVEIEATVDTDDQSRNMEIDQASHKNLEATQQSWLLGEDQKRKKYIDLGCIECSKRFFFTAVCLFLTAGLIAGLVSVIIKTAPRKHRPPPVLDNYTTALHHALNFFDAQKSGHLPKSNNISYRGDSALADGNFTGGSFGYPNLVGGFYDAGDNIKFGFPQSFAMTMLSWSVIEYRSKYITAGELDHVRAIIKWGTDYLLKTFNSTAPPGEIQDICAQVGQGHVADASAMNDHACWNSPEQMAYDRPVYRTTSAPDLAGEMTAALAAASIVFKDNATYSAQLVFAAKSVYAFATDLSKRSLYTSQVPDALEFYNSSGYWDEFLWGGAWLYYATGNLSYLDYVTNAERAGNANVANTRMPMYGVLSWDNKLAASQILLTRLRLLVSPGYPYETMLEQYQNHTEIVMCSYLPDYKSFNTTAGGLTLLNSGKPGTLFYTVNAAFLASLYADYLDASGIPGWSCGLNFQKTSALREFAKSQVDYILWKNPMNMSYVVGYGKKYPQQVHHRAASTPSGQRFSCDGGFANLNRSAPNPHILDGALVGGPYNGTDKFLDDRRSYQYTEPTLHGNAGLVAALISLSSSDLENGPRITGIDRNTMFSNIPPMYPASPPPPPPYKP